MLIVSRMKRMSHTTLGLAGACMGGVLGYGCVRLWMELILPESHRGLLRSDRIMRIGDVFFTAWEATVIVVALTFLALAFIAGGLLYAFGSSND